MPSLTFCKDIVRRFEDPRTPFLNVIFTFIAAITLRNYLEQFSDRTAASLITEVHYVLCYISLAMALILLFHMVTNETVEKIARAILPGFIILPFVPVVDLLLSFGRGYPITYFLPGVHHHLWQGFLFLGRPFEGHGVTPGQRMEIVLVIFLSGIYGYLKTNDLLRSVLLALLAYVTIFLYAVLPFVLKMIFDPLGIPVDYTPERMIWLYLLLILPLSQGLFYLYNKKYFMEIWKDSRPLRNIHFQLMVLLGLVFMLNHAVQLPTIQLSWIFIPPAITFAVLFSVIINNIEDEDIDRISNKERPTVTKTISLGAYKNLSWIFLGLALVYAGAVNFICLLTILLCITNYFLYSSPPFRLKRVPFFSKLLISINSLLLFSLGYFLPNGVIEIPCQIILYFLVCFTAVINFIDIKDYEGDRNAGIMTLPTLLGLERSKFLIAIFFLLTYPMSFFLVKDIRLLPVMALTGIILFSLINRKDYSEKPVFMAYLLSIVFMIMYFWWTKQTGQFLNTV